MPLTALRYVRKMRGGAKPISWKRTTATGTSSSSGIIRSTAGFWSMTCLLRRSWNICRSPLPRPRLSASRPSFCRESRGAPRRSAPESPSTGLALRSRYPGDPERTAVYDFLPDALLAQVANPEISAPSWSSISGSPMPTAASALLPRHGAARRRAGGRPGLCGAHDLPGFAFNGPHWDLPRFAHPGPLCAPHGLRGRCVPSTISSLGWSRRSTFPKRPWTAPGTHSRPPGSKATKTPFSSFERLFERRGRLPDLIAASRSARTNPFPNWQPAT